MGNDVDDALALAMLYRYADEGGEKFSPAAGKFSSVNEKFVEGPHGRVCIDDFGMSSFTAAPESLNQASESLTSPSESLQTVLYVAPEDRQAVLDRMVELTVKKVQKSSPVTGIDK